MADSDHIEWLKQGRAAWNGRRKLIKFSPDLSGFDFQQVFDEIPLHLGNDDFSRFNFADANLRGAKLKGLDFSKARFERADLFEADLSSSRFTHAKFNKANMRGAVAEGASFENATFIGTLGAKEVIAQSFPHQDTDGTRWRFLDGGFQEERLPDFNLAQSYRLKSRAAAPDTEAIDTMRASQKEPTYLVTFATNRIVIRDYGQLIFGDERDDELHYGACQVHVPLSHKVGSLGSPLWKRLLKGDDRLKIRQIYELSGDLYWQFVHQNFSELFDATPPTVIIHGYNVGFERAVLWAAQIGYDLGLMRGINLFSWPSRDRIHSYQADESTVESSKYHLASYLLDFIERAGEHKINVIAHSMGCRCLASALEVIGLRHPEKLSRFNHLIFAAADVDQETMRNVGAHVIGNSGRTTSYICSKDKAVQLSAVIHQFARVGFLPPVFLLDAMDTVEVEKGNLWELGHSYVSDAKELLMDIHQILKSSTPPAERFSIRPGTSGHWVLKD
ncbi:alpha/beta hydrolase [Agrobacterium sp. rho-13.3]|uniref:alpha/beta hydrolase n=1 Tax=Agrobacterium sp. rho-13.3 TaxID=3072980 RepID=UPI002A125715|nr:alpha/beta hydrolase [Agrobacterium sp. rho-13.3]MDX8306251.1 alpha/beta hydrolase [Agrobacterium sp. rho-13.3]MDX8307418.1 alpha/beta hydrolase [Agrobacterium sp. rho-13.3]